VAETQTNCIRLGIVNNMPDGALQATERQFVSLLNDAAGHTPIQLKFYALDEVPRSDSARHWMAAYSSAEVLSEDNLDVLVVTGTEPQAADLRDEPYWQSLTRLVEWAKHNTISTIWSCLAAHAAVLYLDGVRRVRLQDKRCGIFDCVVATDDELTAGGPGVFPMPHSRWNDLPEEQLTAADYRILSHSDEAGVDAFAKRYNSLFVFFQGHPEYETDTLLLEYRRDVRRFLTRETEKYPRLPRGYFDEDTTAALTDLRSRSFSQRSPELLSDFPNPKQVMTNTWRPAAVHIYRQWLSYVAQQKHEKETGPMLVAG